VTGDATGSFNLIESLRVGVSGNTYEGWFDFRPYDINGNFEPGGEHKGQVTATRITLTMHGAD
jgi:hypothetical protein